MISVPFDTIYCYGEFISNKFKTPILDIAIMTPASIIPHKHAIMLFLKSILNILAASIPVHAPVPGIGIPIKSTSAINNPLPAVSCNFRPALLPFSIQNQKNYYIVHIILLTLFSLISLQRQSDSKCRVLKYLSRYFCIFYSYFFF